MDTELHATHGDQQLGQQLRRADEHLRRHVVAAARSRRRLDILDILRCSGAHSPRAAASAERESRTPRLVAKERAAASSSGQRRAQSRGTSDSSPAAPSSLAAGSGRNWSPSAAFPRRSAPGRRSPVTRQLCRLSPQRKYAHNDWRDMGQRACGIERCEVVNAVGIGGKEALQHRRVELAPEAALDANDVLALSFACAQHRHNRSRTAAIFYATTSSVIRQSPIVLAVPGPSARRWAT